MKTFTRCLILVLLAVFLVACSTQPTTTKPATMAETLDKADSFELALLKGRFERLNEQNNISASAQSATGTPSACSRYGKYVDAQSIQSEYERIGVTDNALSGSIATAIELLGKNTAKAAYEEMQAGIVPDCSSSNVTSMEGTDAIKVFAKMIDQYGPENAESKVVRAAYLKAVKGEVREAVGKLAKAPGEDEADPNQLILYLARQAKEWQFTATDIGVPADLAKKLEL